MTNSWSLERVIDALRNHQDVQAVVQLGSTARGVKPWSDYDLLVVLPDTAPPLRIVATWIDGRFTDVLFFRVSDLRTPIPELSHWITTGRIVFDRTGLLSSMQPLAPPATP
ncbi:MAG: nucleotidyltransferase domain-containing protein, partial [Chloroflexi bacterium]|nr:nucleotidyltransferase domain-containing protein [Chloroflexota bacterium]